MFRHQHSHTRTLMQLRSEYDSFISAPLFAAYADLTKYQKLNSPDQSIERYKTLLNELTHPKGMVYNLIQHHSPHLLADAERIQKIITKMGGVAQDNTDAIKALQAELATQKATQEASDAAAKKALDDEKAETLQLRAELQRMKDEKAAAEAEQKAASDKATADKAAEDKKLDIEKLDIEKHLEADFSRLMKVEKEQNIHTKRDDKAEFIKEGLKYLEKIAFAELESQKYTLSIVKEQKGSWLKAASVNTKLDKYSIKEMAENACQSSKSPDAINVELNQAIGWIEYINIKKICNGGNINSEIDKRTKGEITLATKMAYIEDELSNHKSHYDAIKVTVTHKTPGILFKGTAAKEESLYDFIETNLKHAAHDMYSHNVEEGLQYLSHCIDAINHCDPVHKTGITIDMHTLLH